MKCLGIIGGMGPLATIDLFKKITDLTPARMDQEHIHIIIDSYPQIEDRTAFLIGKGASPLPKLIESAKRLESAGADILLMPCNTAHYFANEIEKSVNIPLLHIVKNAAESVKSDYPGVKKIGLFATTGTKQTGIYEKVLVQYGFEIVPFPENLENDIMNCIYNGVKAGKTEEYAPLFQKCADTACSLGSEILIAGCTETPLLIPYIKPKVPFLDATYELAKKAVKIALGN